MPGHTSMLVPSAARIIAAAFSQELWSVTAIMSSPSSPARSMMNSGSISPSAHAERTVCRCRSAVKKGTANQQINKSSRKRLAGHESSNVKRDNVQT